MKKIAVIITHPIYYYVPIFKKISKDIDIEVFYFSTYGVKKSYDIEFGKEIKWDDTVGLLKDYKYKFLWNPYSGRSTPSWKDFAPSIIKEIIFKNYDFYLVVNWNTITHWLAFLFLIIFNKKIIIRAESPYNQEILKSKCKLFIKKIIFGKILFPKVYAFLYIGEENRKFYKFYGVPDEKLFFAPYAVDNERFQKEYEKLKYKKEGLRKELGIEPDDVVILFVGKLIPKKQPMDLLKAYESILGTSDVPSIDGNILTSDVHLLYVGDGELRLNLEKYTKEHNLKNVHFVGFKNQTEISKYYVMSDIFVLPSDVGETWGLVVNEAMNFRLPVIVSDLVGCGTDLVKHGENGYIFKTGDIEELARYLEEFISYNPKYLNVYEFTNNTNEKNNSLDKFVSHSDYADNNSDDSHIRTNSYNSDYSLKRRLQFGEKSFEIVKNYNYDKTVESILKIINKN
jgi:glycosyltransferase involved in cell wall biosynthesis